MEHPMKLHTNAALFEEILDAASQPVTYGGLGIEELFIEKDYWISKVLKQLSIVDTWQRVIFKGGTSLSKVYGIGNRFSEDIDIAISDAKSLSENQLKKLMSRTEHGMADGLTPIDIPGRSRKTSLYRKSYYSYPRISALGINAAVNAGQILIETNAFANPYPHGIHTISSFITSFLEKHHAFDIIKQYGLEPFPLPVLDKRRTLTEKLVSLMRYSLADEPLPALQAKIRHIYDLHYLLNDTEVSAYLASKNFQADFISLFMEDQSRFNYPQGWQNKCLSDSPLLNDFDAVWSSLSATYLTELPSLAYSQIPPVEAVRKSLIQILTKMSNPCY